MPPPPPPDPRAGHGVESPSVVRAPDRHMSRGTSSRRPLRPRRWSDISPEASPLLQSAQGERYGERQHHRARDESRGSESPPSSSKRCRRLEGGRKGSPIGGRHWSDDDDDDDDEGTGSRGQYDHELAYPSSCHRARHHLGSNNKRTFSPRHHGERSLSVQHHPSPRGKPQLPLPMEMSPWDDGYTSPSSPSYPREVEQYRQRGLHDDDDQDMTPGCLYSAPGSSDGSGISGREPSFKYEDSVLNTECKDFAYDALVDDFMDAVVKTWRNRNPNLKVDKDAHQKQTNRFAELALKRYNKNKNNKRLQYGKGWKPRFFMGIGQVKYALVEATDGGAIFEDSEIYAHVNFYAKAKNGPKKHDGKVLVFAELHQVGRRLNAMVLTCFRFLDENNQLCGRRDQIPNSLIMQNQDMGHCYACTGKINHPDGSCYKAGHIVSTLCYLPN